MFKKKIARRHTTSDKYFFENRNGRSPKNIGGVMIGRPFEKIKKARVKVVQLVLFSHRSPFVKVHKYNIPLLFFLFFFCRLLFELKPVELGWLRDTLAHMRAFIYEYITTDPPPDHLLRITHFPIIVYSDR